MSLSLLSSTDSLPGRGTPAVRARAARTLAAHRELTAGSGAWDSNSETPRKIIHSLHSIQQMQRSGPHSRRPRFSVALPYPKAQLRASKLLSGKDDLQNMRMSGATMIG